MSHTDKLSLPAAILININIMLGAGVFLNTQLLAQQAGALGFLSYATIGLLMFPLALSLAKLLEYYPVGGFYTFAEQTMHPFAGFISTWSYFTGKLASATIMIHASVITISSLIPILSVVNPFILDIAVIALFVSLNLCNMKTGTTIQVMFSILKAIPIVFAILAGLFLFDGNNLRSVHQLWTGIPQTIPFIIYATMGFEAACSLSSKIINPKKNGPRAIVISYAITLVLITAYQFFFYGALCTQLCTMASYREAFPALACLLSPVSTFMTQKCGGLLNLAIATSALGGAYGILFSNSWNLYTLAEKKQLLGARLLTKLNKNAIPFLCVAIEGIICILYLFIALGNQAILQQVSSLGVILAYSMSVMALAIVTRKKQEWSASDWIPFAGVINCILLTTACINGLINTGMIALIFFVLLLALGTLLFWQKNTSESLT